MTINIVMADTEQVAEPPATAPHHHTHTHSHASLLSIAATTTAAGTVIKPSSLFSASLIMSPPSGSMLKPVNHCATPQFSFTTDFFVSPTHTFIHHSQASHVNPYIATAPHLALDGSLSLDDDGEYGSNGSNNDDNDDGDSHNENQWLQRFDDKTQSSPLHTTTASSISTPYYSDLSTVSAEFDHPQSHEQQPDTISYEVVSHEHPHYDYNYNHHSGGEAQPVFAPASSIFQEPEPMLVMPHTVAAVPVVLGHGVAHAHSANPPVELAPLVSVDPYPAQMSRSLAIVKGHRSVSAMYEQVINSSANTIISQVMSTPAPVVSVTKTKPMLTTVAVPLSATPAVPSSAASVMSRASAKSKRTVSSVKSNPRRLSGSKRRRPSISSSDDSDSDSDSSSSCTSSSDEDDSAPPLRKKQLSKRERNKLSAKAYRKRKKDANSRLSDQNTVLSNTVQRQKQEIDSVHTENQKLKQQNNILQALLSNKIFQLFSLSKSSSVSENVNEMVKGAEPPVALPAPPTPLRLSSPAPAMVPAIASMNAQGVVTLHSPEAASLPVVASLTAASAEQSLVKAEPGSPTVVPANPCQRTGMLLLVIFSCFLLFHPDCQDGSRKIEGCTAEQVTPITVLRQLTGELIQSQYSGNSGTSASASPTAGAGVLGTLAAAATSLASTAIKTESSALGALVSSDITLPITAVKQEPTGESVLMEDESSAPSSVSEQPIAFPLVADVHGVLRSWLSTADAESVLADLRAVSFEPLVQMLGEEGARQAMRDFAASFV